MKNTLILASFLALAPLAKGQLLLEALDAPEAIVLPTLPNGITISNGQHFIASIYDTDYLPYQVPTSTAVWTTVSADNQPEGKVIDYQGIVPATGINVQIPITATGNATLPAFTSSEIAIDPQGEEGVANSNRKVVLSWAQQNITSSTKFITAVIKPSNNLEIKVKKLDLNGGLGNDYKGTLLANFSLPKSNLNTTEKVGYELRVLSGIPDKNFYNQTTIEGIQAYRHQFIYLPIQGPDGKIWLNNNLGADYANLNSEWFNHTHQAGARDVNGNLLFTPSPDQIKKDFRGYGSVFQWQRPSDGHELIKWTSPTVGIPLNTKITRTVSSNSNWTAGHSDFVINRTSTYSWVNNTINRTSGNRDLWQKNTLNNPCPTGFHVPTIDEWENLQKTITGTTGNGGNKMWNEKSLHLTATGFRESTDGDYLNEDGSRGKEGIVFLLPSEVSVYWSSSIRTNTFHSWSLSFDNSNTYPYDSYGTRADGMPIRCIQD